MRRRGDELEISSREAASEEDSRLLAALATYADPPQSRTAAHMATRVLSIARQKQAVSWPRRWTAALLLPALVCFVTIIVTYRHSGSFPGHKEHLAAHASRAVPLLAASSSPLATRTEVARRHTRRDEHARKHAFTPERSIEPQQAQRAIFPTPAPLSREEQLMLAVVHTASPSTQQLIAHMTQPLLPSRTQADSFPPLSENQPQGVSDEIRP